MNGNLREWNYPSEFVAGIHAIVRARVEGNQVAKGKPHISAFELRVDQVGENADAPDLPGNAVEHDALALPHGPEVEQQFRLLENCRKGGLR